MTQPNQPERSEPHCPSCTCGRRAPVQRQEQRFDGKPARGPGTIAWWEHMLAYSDYSHRYGSSQSAERLAERGGFGYLELVDFLGHEPTTWSPR